MRKWWSNVEHQPAAGRVLYRECLNGQRHRMTQERRGDRNSELEIGHHSPDDRDRSQQIRVGVARQPVAAEAIVASASGFIRQIAKGFPGASTNYTDAHFNFLARKNLLLKAPVLAFHPRATGPNRDQRSVGSPRAPLPDSAPSPSASRRSCGRTEETPCRRAPCAYSRNPRSARF